MLKAVPTEPLLPGKMIAFTSSIMGSFYPRTSMHSLLSVSGSAMLQGMGGCTVRIRERNWGGGTVNGLLVMQA